MLPWLACFKECESVTVFDNAKGKVSVLVWNEPGLNITELNDTIKLASDDFTLLNKSIVAENIESLFHFRLISIH